MPARAGVPLQARQQLEQPVGEPVERVGGVVLEAAEVDDEVDRRLVGPDVRARGRPGSRGWPGPARRGLRGRGVRWPCRSPQWARKCRGGLGRVLLALDLGLDHRVGVALHERGQRRRVQVERSAGGQRVHHGPGDQQRARRGGPRGRRSPRRGRRRRTPPRCPSTVSRVPVGDLGGRVLVDAHAEQVGRGRHERQQPAVAGPLVEVLVDDDVRAAGPARR